MEFCCIAHENYFIEDFISDDDSAIPDSDPRLNATISFMPCIYEDAVAEINQSRNTEENSVQCEFSRDKSLSSYSLMPVYESGNKEKILTPKRSSQNLTHFPRVFFKKEKKAENCLSNIGVRTKVIMVSAIETGD